MCQRQVKIDPRIWVREFHRAPGENIWYTPEEMGSFKQEAVQRILAYTEVLPTGTGRTVPCAFSGRALFSHKALSMEVEEPSREETIKSILVVDPHEICLKLFAKSFQQALPSVSITTAQSYQEALGHASVAHFDLIVVEERLQGTSGALLIQRLAKNCRDSLFIGVSAHPEQDALRLRFQADVVWPKPPPPIDTNCMNRLRRLLRAKRSRLHPFS